MSGSRRPSVSIYDYPEHLNPFNDEDSAVTLRTRVSHESATKDGKNKFWTFGRSRKKRSHSFSIKSTWNGLFGKRKEPGDYEKRSTITTVSTTYKRDSTERPPIPAARLSKDQKEFDEALGTLARRRKYTLDLPSRYGSSLTVNGDASRIYDGSPQDTTTSILDNVTPKPPARRFGQVSPRPTDKIPPLDYGDSEAKVNGVERNTDQSLNETPVPPRRRTGLTSSLRYNTSPVAADDESNRSGDVSLRDENENVADDYVFKRFSQDAVRRSNLSINSCMSITSTASTYGRKKRRAPPPPRPKEVQEHQEGDDNIRTATDNEKIELQITEPIDIARVTENIDAMTKKSEELDQTLGKDAGKKVEEHTEEIEHEKSAVIEDSKNEEIAEDFKENVQTEDVAEEVEDSTEQLSQDVEQNANETLSKECVREEKLRAEEIASDRTVIEPENPEIKDTEIDVEYHRASTERLEIVKDVDATSSDNVSLEAKYSSESLSRSDSFSVKEEIEKIEKQIKALESKSEIQESTEGRQNDKEENDDNVEIRNGAKNTKASIQANRRNFFQHLVEENKDGVQIGFKEFPREQRNFDVIRLTDPPVPVDAPRDPVKVIELHISEPIRQRPEIVDDVNPIPKPRRHSALSLRNGVNSQKTEHRAQSSEN